MAKKNTFRFANLRTRVKSNNLPQKKSGDNRKCWLCRILARFWTFLGRIDTIALLNCTLLIGIIVLFSILLYNVLCGCQTRIINAPQIEMVDIKPTPEKKIVQSPRSANLPIRKKNPAAIKRSHVNQKYNGNVFISGALRDKNIGSSDTINGDLYLEEMRYYKLPCDVKINGNLHVRNVGQLTFCGKFFVSGDIFIEPNSSFGPIPRDAKIDGFIIL